MLNHCDYDRLKVLAPIGNALAWGWHVFVRGTHCPCCLGTRLVLSLAAAAGLGALVAL